MRKQRFSHHRKPHGRQQNRQKQKDNHDAVAGMQMQQQLPGIVPVLLVHHGLDKLVSSRVRNSTSAGRLSVSMMASARRSAGAISPGKDTRSAATPRPSATRV